MIRRVAVDTNMSVASVPMVVLKSFLFAQTDGAQPRGDGPRCAPGERRETKLWRAPKPAW